MTSSLLSRIRNKAYLSNGRDTPCACYNWIPGAVSLFETAVCHCLIVRLENNLINSARGWVDRFSKKLDENKFSCNLSTLLFPIFLFFSFLLILYESSITFLFLKTRDICEILTIVIEYQ